MEFTFFWRFGVRFVIILRQGARQTYRSLRSLRIKEQPTSDDVRCCYAHTKLHSNSSSILLWIKKTHRIRVSSPLYRTKCFFFDSLSFSVEENSFQLKFFPLNFWKEKNSVWNKSTEKERKKVRRNSSSVCWISRTNPKLKEELLKENCIIHSPNTQCCFCPCRFFGSVIVIHWT